MKSFLKEFKTFITRGNVVDMAVGVIVGSSFTAIVNGMSNFILKPIINWFIAILFGADSLKDIYWMLLEKTTIDPDTGAEITDLANSIYIDWGSFINAVLNFFLVALVLFVIVKIINKFREEHKDNIAKYKLSKEQKSELKAAGIKRRDKNAVKAYFEQKARLEAEAAAKAAEEEAKRAAEERAANPTVEDLLKDIRELLKK